MRNLLIVLREIMNMYTRANKKQIFKIIFHAHMHMVEMLTGWMHLQHQHGSRAQEWQQQEHLSHECRQ